MIVTIRGVNEELKEDGSPKYIEWDAVGADGKEVKPKIYPAIQVNEQWIHFEDRWDEFKDAKNKTYEIERASIKIGQKTWMPIVKATKVKDTFKQKAIVEVQATQIDERQISIEGQVALKEIGELIRAEKLVKAHEKLGELYFIKLYDMMNKFVYGGKVEKKQSAPQVEPDKKAGPSQEIPADETAQGRDDRLARMREYVATIGWVKADKWKFKEFIQKTFQKESIDNLTNAELNELESHLKEMAELK